MTLFRGDDYPLEALKRNEQGSVGVALVLDEQGRVTQCIVTMSSGSPALDSQTCRTFVERGKFEPARDATGKAVASGITQLIAWKMMESKALPKPAVLPELLNLEDVFTSDEYPDLAIFKEEQGRAVAGLGVDHTGKVVDCIILNSSGSAALDAQTCRLLSTRARFKPGADANGAPMPSAVVQPVTWMLEGKQVVWPNTAWAERLVIRFSPAGIPADCRIEVAGIEADPEDPYECKIEDLGDDRRLPKEPALPTAINTAIEESRFFPGELLGKDVPPPSGDKLVMRRFVGLKLGTNGRVIDCRELHWEGLVEPPAGACDLVPGLFEPFSDAAGEPVVGTGTMMFSIYVRTETLS